MDVRRWRCSPVYSRRRARPTQDPAELHRLSPDHPSVLAAHGARRELGSADQDEKERIRRRACSCVTMKDIDRTDRGRGGTRHLRWPRRPPAASTSRSTWMPATPTFAPGVGHARVAAGSDYREAHLVMEIVADFAATGRRWIWWRCNPDAGSAQRDSRIRRRTRALGARQANSVVGPELRAGRDLRPTTPSSFSISSITSFIRLIVRSSGSSVVMSTPASFSRSIGYFDPPAAEERQVALRRVLVARQHFRRQRLGGGERRGVLEDVEVPIEVRDEAPLMGDVVVHDRDLLIVAVVLARDVQIELGKRVAGDRLARAPPSRASAARTPRTASAGTPSP